MKIWLLSHLKDSPGNRLFLEAAARRGHSVRHVDPTRVALTATTGKDGLAVHQEGERLTLPDLVFTRMGGSAPPVALQVLRQLEALGVECVNRSGGIALARDKFSTAQTLAAKGLPFPPTALLGGGAGLDGVLQAVAGPPWIVKLPVSTQGAGVMLAESARSLRSICDTLQSTGQQVLVQAFVPEAKSTDIRVLVLGNRALAAMRRSGQGDEFRSNLHRGGRAELVEPSPELADLAVRAARALALPVAGIDFLEGRDEPYIIEVNSSPGLEGISSATSRDLASEVVAYLEQRVA